MRDYYERQVFNRHYLIQNDDITQTKLIRKFDAITCISTLEHIKSYNLAIENMLHLLVTGGHIILSFPYNKNQFIENAYDLPQSSSRVKRKYVCQIFSQNEIEQWVKGQTEIVSQRYFKDWGGTFWSCGRRLSHPIEVKEGESCDLTCLTLRKL